MLAPSVQYEWKFLPYLPVLPPRHPHECSPSLLTLSAGITERLQRGPAEACLQSMLKPGDSTLADAAGEAALVLAGIWHFPMERIRDLKVRTQTCVGHGRDSRPSPLMCLYLLVETGSAVTIVTSWGYILVGKDHDQIWCIQSLNLRCCPSHDAPALQWCATSQAEGKTLDVAAAIRSMEVWCRARSSGQDAGKLLREIVDIDRQVHTLCLAQSHWHHVKAVMMKS